MMTKNEAQNATQAYDNQKYCLGRQLTRFSESHRNAPDAEAYIWSPTLF